MHNAMVPNSLKLILVLGFWLVATPLKSAVKCPVRYPMPETVIPSVVDVKSGNLVAGNSKSVADSDDSRLDVLAEVADQSSDPEIAILFLGNAIDTEFETLTIRVEAFSNTLNLVQSIEMFDFISNGYVEVDLRDAEIDEAVIEIVLTENVNRFVPPNSGQIISKLKFRDSGPVLFFPWAIEVDQLNWILSD